VGWITTFLIGGATTLIAVVMAASGQSVFQIMLKFNTLISLAYGPPALLGVGGAEDAAVVWTGFVCYRTRSGDAGCVCVSLDADSAGCHHYSGILWGIFLSMLLDRGDTPARARLFKNLNTPIDVARELKDSEDFTAPVFRFLSRTISFIGLLSLLLLFTTPASQRTTVLWFAGLTLAVGGPLWFVRGGTVVPAKPRSTIAGLPIVVGAEGVPESMIRLGVIGCGQHSENGHAIPLARYKAANPGQLNWRRHATCGSN